MCTVCGCESGGSLSDNHSQSSHDHENDNDHVADHLHFGSNRARLSVAGMDQDQIISIERNILDKNNALANANRHVFQKNTQFAVNILSSPGAGNTNLLIRTIEELRETWPIIVIEGDQETANDAERIRETGVRAVQINTGKGCHLDAHMVRHAMEQVRFEPGGLTLIENVGNLVCPAAFDLGESRKVVILSVTEGEDKPIKYPDMFAVADLMILSKVDLLPYLKLEVDRAVEYARRVKPNLQVIEFSVESSTGMSEWVNWLRSGVLAVTSESATETCQAVAEAHA